MLNTIITTILGTSIVWYALYLFIHIPRYDKICNEYYKLKYQYIDLKHDYDYVKRKLNYQEENCEYEDDLPQRVFDAYRFFDLGTDASLTEVKKKFRSLIKKYHPDVYKETDGAAKFAEINASYSIIEQYLE